jgi:hypothetical protein
MTPFTRLRAIAVTVLMTAGMGVTTAPTASAVPTCEYFGDLPARISIDRPDFRVAVPLRGCEGHFDYAVANIYGPWGWEAVLVWNGTRTAYWSIFDWHHRPGVYNTADGEGLTADTTTPTWRGDTTTVKFATWSGVGATRSGSRVSINALATRYDGASDKFIPFGNRVIAFEQCVTPTGSCSVLAYAKTNGVGRASITVNAPAGRYYRMRFGESPSFWGSTSTVVRS